MPFQSPAQERAMYAAADGNSTIGIPEEAAEKFIDDSEDEPVHRPANAVEAMTGNEVRL